MPEEEIAGQVAQQIAQHADWIPYAGMLFVLFLVVVIGALIFNVIRMRSQERERIATLAIQHNQPEVARLAVRRSAPWLPWIVLGIVTCVIFAKIPWYATMIIAIVAIGTFHIWFPLLTGHRDETERKEKAAAEQTGRPAGPAPAHPAPPRTGENPPAQ